MTRATSVTPGTIACQASLSMGFPRQEHWTRLPFPSPGNLPNALIEPRSPAPQADSLQLNHQGSPCCYYILFSIYLFLSALGLCYCSQAFFGCGEQDLLFIAVYQLLVAELKLGCAGFSSCTTQALERGPSSCGARA